MASSTRRPWIFNARARRSADEDGEGKAAAKICGMSCPLE